MMQRQWWWMVGALSTGCAANDGRVTFNNGTPDAGTFMDVNSDTRFPNLGRDALPVRDTGPVVINEDAACATTTADAQRRPMNLLIVLDRSGSMNERGRGAPTTAPTKWNAAVAALRALLTRLDDETRVGITFFPSTSGDGTVAATYATPAVPVGPLSATRASILARLGATSPNGNTPMTCAIQGSTSYWRGYTMDGSRNVILITDGLPTEECTNTAMECGPLPNLLDLPAFMAWALCRDRVGTNAVRVAVALAQRESPAVRTFVAGTPEASDTFLSDLAVGGGSQRTADCRPAATCHYSLRGGTFEADLSAAFDEIRGRALSCEFAINIDPMRADPTRVNVNYEGMGGARVIPRDVDHRDGWDYSPGMRSVILYGAACDRLRSDSTARIRILFGCPTVTPG
jgi:hypothetical protein